PLSAQDVGKVVDRALVDERGLGDAVGIEEEAREQVVRMAGSDARKSLTVLEAAAGAVLSRSQEAGQDQSRPVITLTDV
nr:recombinase RarA [Streptococcus anginosus]